MHHHECEWCLCVWYLWYVLCLFVWCVCGMCGICVCGVFLRVMCLCMCVYYVVCVVFVHVDVMFMCGWGVSVCVVCLWYVWCLYVCVSVCGICVHLMHISLCKCASFCIQILLEELQNVKYLLCPPNQNARGKKLARASGHFLSTVIESLFLGETEVVKHFW